MCESEWVCVGECMRVPDGLHSYDLDLDTKLAEETTVLVESYTVI